MKVNEETRKVIGKQLKWLPDCLSKYVHEITFEVLDLNTLSLNSWNLTRYEMGLESISFYTQQGIFLGTVGKEKRSKSYRLRWLRKMLALPESRFVPYYFYEDVAEAIVRLAPRSLGTQYILRIDSDRATLYKVPKNTTIKDHLAVKSDEAGQKLAEFISDA